MSNKSVIGVDLDGINIRTGKVKNGKIISDFSLRLSSKESSEEILQKLIKSIKKIYSDDVTGIGIGIPGLVDVKEGIVYNVENIPSWKNIHLKEKLEVHFQVSIYVNNDKNCFAAGEKYFGSGRNYRNIVGLIIGKRMGAGTLIDNRLNPGMSFSAGEFGKIPYKKRTFEYYCSEQFFSDEHKIDVDDLIRKSEKGDQQALKIFNQFGNHLGDAILTLLYAGNPEIIILGGSLTKIFSLVKDSMWEKVKSFPYKHMIENIKIEISKQQEIAILGAAALYYDAKKTRILEIAEQKSKNAEEALQKERNLLNVILDSIPDNIYIKDSKSHITKVNKAMATTFGAENYDQVVGKTDFDFFKKEHAQQVYDAEQKLMRTGEPLINFEEKETWPDGSETWVSTSKIPLKDKNGKITGIIGISKDITNRKNIENEIQRRATQASVLYETGQRLSSELDIGSLLSEIVHAVCEAFSYYGVMLLLPDKDAKALTLRSIAGGYENVFPDDLTLKFGEGLIGMAASTKKIQMSGDVSKDPDYVKKAEEVTQSELAVPLKSGRKVIGVLDIQSDKLNAFDKTDVAAMETLSSQIASAIENARLYDQAQQEIAERKRIEKEIQHRATQATLLYKTGQKLSSELDLDSLLNEIVTTVCETYNYNGVMLLLPDENAKALTLRSIAGDYKNVFPDDLTLKFGEGMIGKAASTKKIQVSGDVTKDSSYVKKVEEVTHSELSVPITSGKKIIGVLDIQSDKIDAFDSTDVEAMEILSNQIASTIENANLYDQAQQEIAERKRIEKEIQHRATQATLLYKTGQKLSSELDLDSLLNEIVTTVCETYNYNGVMLLLPDENAKALTLRSIAGDYKNVFPDDLTLKFGEGMIGKAASTKKIQVSGDVTKDSSYVKKVEEVTHSELSVPIKSGKKIIGVLDIQSDKIDAFDSTDVEAMEILSSQIASTIENARLYDQAQQEIADRKRAELEVRKSNDNLEKAKKETDNILHNVEEGLLLINPSFNVGSQYSSALESILCETNLASKNFISILKNRVGDETVSSVKEYLDLMFTSNIDENMLIDLNPLINIELVFNRGSEKSTLSKILIFKFQRIIVNKKIVELIVTVNDITERVKLEKDLEKTREENKRRMDWLLCILNVEPVMLREFVQSARDEIENVEKTLQGVEQNEQILESLDNVYRSVHTMKGNASLLEIDFFAEKAHQVEDKIAKLRNKKQITLQDMNELFDQVKMVQTVYEEIKRLLDQIGQIHDQFRPKRSHEHNLLVKSLSKLVSILAREHKKQIELVTNNFKGDIIPYKHRLLIRDVLVQLIRNSIFHGIEEEAERKDRGKKTIGILEIENFKKNGNFILKFKDDGRGLLLDKLREKAKEQGKWSPDEIKKWDDQKLTEIIFIPGVTTSEQATMTAGRGMGMDIIKNKVAKIGGKINITTKEGLFTEFDIILPIHD